MGIVIDIDFLYLEFYVVGIMFVVLFNYYLVEINDKLIFLESIGFMSLYFIKLIFGFLRIE